MWDARPQFDAAEQLVTPDFIQTLRRLQKTSQEDGTLYDGLAWAVERQSDGLDAHGDPNHTGHISRVQKIVAMARRYNYYLPTPIERENRTKEDPRPPFIFDDRFWFVDGEAERATGHDLSPEMRPRLWMLYATMRRLKQLDSRALPKAILIADETRFMRADHWLKNWYRAIAGLGVDLIFSEGGRVQADQLEFVQMKIRVQSERFQEYRNASVKIALGKGRVPWGRMKFGLQLENDGFDVVAQPEQWPVIYEVVRALATGDCPSLRKVPVYTRKVYGEALVELGLKGGAVSCAMAHAWLQPGSFLEGIKVFNDKEWTPIVVREDAGIFDSYSYTKSRHKRYFKEELPEEKWMRKEILHRHGTEPIPPELLAQARLKTSTRGRPRKSDPTEEERWLLIPPRIARCIHCKSAIRELPPYRPADGRKVYGWLNFIRLECQLKGQLTNNKGYTPREIRHDLPIGAHRPSCCGRLTAALLPLLKERLFLPALPVTLQHTAESTGNDLIETQLQQEKALQSLTRKLKSQLLAREEIDRDDEPDNWRLTNERISELQAEIKSTDASLNQISASLLNQMNRNSNLDRAREWFVKGVQQFEQDPDFWGAVIEMFVTVVWVDMDAMTFVAELARPEYGKIEAKILDDDPRQKFISPGEHELLSWVAGWRTTVSGAIAC